MMVMVPIEIDNLTAERADLILKRYRERCSDEEAVLDFLGGINEEKFTQAAARALLAERYRTEVFG